MVLMIIIIIISSSSSSRLNMPNSMAKIRKNVHLIQWGEWKCRSRVTVLSARELGKISPCELALWNNPLSFFACDYTSDWQASLDLFGGVNLVEKKGNTPWPQFQLQSCFHIHKMKGSMDLSAVLFLFCTSHLCHLKQSLTNTSFFPLTTTNLIVYTATEEGACSCALFCWWSCSIKLLIRGEGHKNDIKN